MLSFTSNTKDDHDSTTLTKKSPLSKHWPAQQDPAGVGNLHIHGCPSGGSGHDKGAYPNARDQQNTRFTVNRSDNKTFQHLWAIQQQHNNHCRTQNTQSSRCKKNWFLKDWPFLSGGKSFHRVRASTIDHHWPAGSNRSAQERHKHSTTANSTKNTILVSKTFNCRIFDAFTKSPRDQGLSRGTRHRSTRVQTPNFQELEAIVTKN